MSKTGESVDLAVIGGGMGGLACAALAQRRGLQVTLLESHTKLGGCAGYFDRGPFTFDVGATALMGLAPGEPIGDLLHAIGVDFHSVRTPCYRVYLPDRTLDITPDPVSFESASAAAFPGRSVSRRIFWRLQAAIGTILFSAANGVPRLPARTFQDLRHDFSILGLRGILAASTSILSVLDVLRLLGLDDDVPFRSLVAMLLQDTAQAGPETVPFANASACLHAYRLGMSRPLGGMASLADGIGHRFALMGGDLRTAALVDRVEVDESGGFVVITRRKARIRARQVAFDLPLDRAAALLGRSLEGRLGRREAQSRAAWSAVTGYLAIERGAVPDDSPLFHQVLQSYDRPIHDGNNVLISLSTPEDPGYGPKDVRVATLSTHTRPADWTGLTPEAHETMKLDYRNRLLSALRRALPDAPEALRHAEFATPRSFQRYTRRVGGAVGGPPVSRSNSNFLAVGSDVLGPGLWVVGDSVFPGQGTMATVLSAIRVVERITGTTWVQMKADPPPDVDASEELRPYNSPQTPMTRR